MATQHSPLIISEKRIISLRKRYSNRASNVRIHQQLAIPMPINEAEIAIYANEFLDKIYIITHTQMKA